ncbi:Transglutaminase-like superfamily protein [Oscillospiraceae bacterium]|nr:Transglutaminase-like superfamily protein [Oscillospiraceae bacterium]
MFLRKVVAAACAAVVSFTGMSFIKEDDVRADVTVDQLYADYTEVHFVSKSGGAIDFGVDGTQIYIDTDCANDIELIIVDENNRPVLQGMTADGSCQFDVASSLVTDTIYYVVFYYTAEGIDYMQWDIYITKRGDGTLAMLKSLCYDFNVERCSELWTDATSLEECLQPQNDVDCDDPEVIAIAEEITRGCTTDWEKSYAIYTFIVENFYYDFIQVEDRYTVYQDDAAALLRRRIAVCEGFGNTFVSLCRAVGVPAAVSFGIGASAPDMLHNNDMIDDESPNHAWACVCLDGTWYHVDPTWDMGNAYEGSSYDSGTATEGEYTYNYYLLPVEIFSMTHKICDADTIHGIECSGSCGDNATYTISRDAVITISGSGEVVLPYGVNGFRFVEFAEGSNITSIGDCCFQDCDALEYVILPDTVTRLERGAFITCEDLEYIYLPEGLQYIGPSAFCYCDQLSYVYVPDSVTEIGDYAFDDCPWLVISVNNSQASGLTSDYDVDPLEIITRT